ncbi:MAG: hypothetical protein JW839_21160 [Candidatus Lokiarchaeota archaeon]|nr:hypothetical protein [Candidatus Lokiarchaeota archaeon]
MVELSNSTVVHSIATGVGLILAAVLLHSLIGAGLVIPNNALMSLGVWLFWIGVIVASLFAVLFFVFNDIV